MTITFIGDAHGKFDQYYTIAKKSDFSIQLGDFGFSEAWNKLHYSDLDYKQHKVLAGNHDNYDICKQSKHYLGDFGSVSIDNKNIFFYRGGLSIDRVYRVGEELSGSKKSWWSQEKLSFTEMLDCIALYSALKPDIVISHVPIKSFANFICNYNHSMLVKYKFHQGFTENTALLGETLFSIHNPSLWISGHFHKDITYIINKTKFISLGELSSFKLE